MPSFSCFFFFLIFPFPANKRNQLNLPYVAKALLIFDVFEYRFWITNTLNQLFQRNNCIFIRVSSSHTHFFQPLDISLNKSAKSYIAGRYQNWYAYKVFGQLNRDDQAHDVNVRLSTIKPLHAMWIIDMYILLTESKGLGLLAFRKAQISHTVRETFGLVQFLKIRVRKCK